MSMSTERVIAKDYGFLAGYHPLFNDVMWANKHEYRPLDKVYGPGESRAVARYIERNYSAEATLSIYDVLCERAVDLSPSFGMPFFPSLVGFICEDLQVTVDRIGLNSFTNSYVINIPLLYSDDLVINPGQTIPGAKLERSREYIGSAVSSEEFWAYVDRNTV